jgi:uroporphyrinogen decarboxylase
LNSRERILAALSHRQPDRVPIDLSGHRSSGISALLYPKLRSYLGLPPRMVRVYDPVQQLAVVDEDLLDLFGADTIELGRGFALDDKDWTDWVLPDGTPCLMPAWARPERVSAGWVLRSRTGRVIGQMPEGAIFFEQANYPFLENFNEEAIPDAMDECLWCAMASPPGPLVQGPNGDAILENGARQLRESTDRAILGLFGGNLLEMGQFLWRADRFLMLLASEPKRTHAFLDRLVEMHLENLDRYLRAVGKHIDVIVFGDDLGMQTGPQVSPRMYREFFKPRHRMMWDRAKKLAGVKIMLHCCGGIRELIPDLIDAGLDALNPVQISARGMAPRELKKEFGRELAFWGGGCETQHGLPEASPDEIRRQVTRLLRIWHPGGGYVFQPVHNILPQVPPENVAVMYEAAKSFEPR